VVGGLNRDTQPALEPGRLDGEKVVQERQLLTQGHQWLSGVTQGRAEQVAELCHEPSRGYRARLGERADRVERVEEKVRLQLRTQRLQLRLDEAPLEIGRPKRQFVGLLRASLHLVGI